MRKLLAVGFGLLFLALLALAIFPNNSDSLHRAVGRVGNWNGTTFSTGGSAVAVSPNWILTVSHVGGTHFEQDGVVYPVLNRINHIGSGGIDADLSLWQVAGPVKFAAPVSFRPFSGAGGLQGQTTTLVGYGITANRNAVGWLLQGGTEGVRRSANNVIDQEMNAVRVETSPGVFKTSDCIVYDLDDPQGENPQNTMGGTAIPGEGGHASLDSGGGWFVPETGRDRLVGTIAYVGTIDGSGVKSWNYHGGVGLAVQVNPYRSWIEATVPDLGRAILENMTLEFGSTLRTGSLANVNESDDLRMELQSPNLVSADLNILLGAVFGARTTASPATQLDVLLEGRINVVSGSMQVALRNWNTGSYDVVRVYNIGSTERTESTLRIPGANYVRSDGFIQLRLRLLSINGDVVFARPTFDLIRIEAR